MSSILLRSLMNDPMVARPNGRAIRRYGDDYWLDDYWPVRRVRRVAPYYGSPVDLMDAMNRNMSLALNSMQEFADDLNVLDSLMGRTSNGTPGNKSQNEYAILKRTESGGLQLSLDVAGFKPEELKINLVNDHLVVEAESESSGEDSYHRNQFKRWFKLPEDCKVEEIRSKLTEDHKLLIDLPGVKPVEQKTRNIPIEVAKTVANPDKSQAKASGDSKNEPQRSK